MGRPVSEEKARYRLDLDESTTTGPLATEVQGSGSAKKCLGPDEFRGCRPEDPDEVLRRRVADAIRLSGRSF